MLFVLRIMLGCLRYPSLLVLRAGAALAPDALGMFAAASWLPGSDASLWCVAGGPVAGTGQLSAADAQLLLRTDSTPGPEGGWMVSRAVGVELLEAWRRGGFVASLDGDEEAGSSTNRTRGVSKYVDDSAAGWRRWLGRRDVRRGRQCAVPELPRVATPDVDGGSGGGALVAAPTPFDLAARNDSRVGKDHADAGGPLTGVDWSHTDFSHVLEPAFGQLVLQVRVLASRCRTRARSSCRLLRVDCYVCSCNSTTANVDLPASCPCRSYGRHNPRMRLVPRLCLQATERAVCATSRSLTIAE